MDRNTAFATLMLINVLGGIIGLSSRTLFSYGLEPLQVSCIRMVVTTVTIGLVMLACNRDSLKVNRRDIWLFVVFGLSKFMADALLFKAQYRIDLSMSTILQMVFYGEYLTVLNIIGMVLVFASMIILNRRGQDTDITGCG